jgi:hypothetical protein
MLIDHYLGDMQRRGRTDESVSIHQVAFMALLAKRGGEKVDGGI